MLSAPRPLGLLPVPVLSSEKLVLEQPSITLAYFCCPRPTLGLLPVLPLLNSDVLFCAQERIPESQFVEISDVLFCAQESQNS